MMLRLSKVLSTKNERKLKPFHLLLYSIVWPNASGFDPEILSSNLSGASKCASVSEWLGDGLQTHPQRFDSSQVFQHGSVTQLARVRGF